VLTNLREHYTNFTITFLIFLITFGFFACAIEVTCFKTHFILSVLIFLPPALIIFTIREDRRKLFALYLMMLLALTIGLSA
jgi:hypothetical protein